MSFNMNFDVNITQTLTQKLTLDQLQHLTILQLSSTELESYIREKANENPLLTLVEPKMDYINNLVDMSSMHSDFPSFQTAEYDENYTQNIFVEKECHLKFLMEQIPLDQNLSVKEKKILNYFIQHLDDNYFLDITVEEVAQHFNVDIAQTEKLLTILQSFEPIGVGARTIEEFLLIQINRDPNAPSLADSFVTDHLDKVASLSVKFLSKHYKISVKETQQIIQYIKSLKAVPTVRSSTVSEEYIIPEISVEKVKNEWILQTNSQLKSLVKVDEDYVEMLKHCTENEDYYQSCLKDVMLLMYGLEQRDRTLYKLTRLLLDIQRDFFEEGIEALQPIKLKDVAKLLDLHDSTVSRAIKNKYIKTPHGIYAYRSLFPKGIANRSGKKDSVTFIKQKIMTFIENENRNSPLTDQKLTDLLVSEGIQISRRTVSKYREALNIVNSDKRVYMYQQ